jgi:hypothetical protein
MTTPGVGPVVALTYRATVDVPARFRKSKAVGVFLKVVLNALRDVDEVPKPCLLNENKTLASYCLSGWTLQYLSECFPKGVQNLAILLEVELRGTAWRIESRVDCVSVTLAPPERHL